MPDIRFRCPACKSKLTVDGRGAGKTIACPRCGGSAIIPQKSTVPPKVTPGGGDAGDASDSLQKEIAEVRFAAARELENAREEFGVQLKGIESERDRLKNELKTKSQAVDNITSALKEERALREQQERSIAERQGKLQAELKEKDEALRRAEEQQGQHAEESNRELEKWKQDQLAEVESAKEKVNEELRKKETMLRNERQTRKKLEEEHLAALESLQFSLEEGRGSAEKARRESAAELRRLESEAEGLRSQVVTRDMELVQVKESLASHDREMAAERERTRAERDQEVETVRATMMEEAAQEQKDNAAALHKANAGADQQIEELRESLLESTRALDEERDARDADANRYQREDEEHRASLERRDAEIAEMKESNASLARRFEEEREQDRVKQGQAESELRQAYTRAEEELKELRESLRDTAQSLVSEQADRKALEAQIRNEIAKRDRKPVVEGSTPQRPVDTPAPAAAPDITDKSESPVDDRAPQGMSVGIAAGWLCLIAGIVMMVLSPAQTWLYGTALVVAMVIGLIVLPRRRSPAVYGLIGMCLLAPGILYVGAAVAGFEGLLPKKGEAVESPPLGEPTVEPTVRSPDPASSSAIGVGESITVDKVRVTFTGVRTGPVTIRDVLGNQTSPEHPFLIVDVTLEAIDPELTIHVKQPWEMTRLVDENDTSLYVVPEQRLSLDHIEGTLRSARLVPGKRFADMLVFELPDKDSAEFRVISDPGIYRTGPSGLHEPVSGDILRLRFSRKDITRDQAA